jgi:hypothetical protein
MTNQAVDDDCDRLLGNAELMRDVASGGFQFVVGDGVAAHCYYALPYPLRLPYGMITPTWYKLVFRVPRLASFASFGGHTDRMSFVQRLTTFVFDLALFETINSSTHFVRKYAPDREPIGGKQLVAGASLLFYIEEPAVGFPMPQMPNTMAVGDVMAGTPVRPLPDDLDAFLSNKEAATTDTSGGAIVVAFGSYFDFIPMNIVAAFCDSFGRLPRGIRVVWKLNRKDACGDRFDRAMILPWIPQNDLLADPRVRLFISHGGLNSLIESVYHAKPLIIFPFASDQPANAATAELRGFAIRMSIAEFTVDELTINIEKILNNATYRENAELASRILRDKPDTAAERVGRMIEHVIKYGDRHLRTGAFDLSPMQFLMFDIFATILLSVLAFVAAVIGCCFCVFSRCKRGYKPVTYPKQKLS